MDLTQLVFYLSAGLAVVSSILMITRRNPVYSAMYLVVTMFAIAAIYVLLGAHFLGALQILVYAGAIMVLFLFVVMLLNLGHDFEPDIRGRLGLVFIGGLGLVLFAEILTVLRTIPGPGGVDVLTPWLTEKGAVAGVAEPLFRNYAVAVEITGVLLLVAMVGAVVIAKRRA